MAWLPVYGHASQNLGQNVINSSAEFIFVGLYDVTYHAFEVRVDDMYHGRGGAVVVGVSAACEAERA